MTIDHDYKYPVYKQNTYAKNGMVATSSPLAAQAGLDILKRGGNAVDAAIATAITLTVVEPTSNGIGGDAFAIVYDKGKLHGLNSSGFAPEGISIETLKAAGYEEIPTFGPVPITVPGAPYAWRDLSEKFGRLPFETLFEWAIAYAENGYVVSDYLSKFWSNTERRYRQLNESFFEDWFKTFTLDHKAPNAGDLFTNKAQAKTLAELARTKCDSFYNGPLAQKISNHIQKLGGFLTLEDFKAYHAEWIDPISINYRGYDIYELPPNGQGVSALMALNILKNFEAPETLDSSTSARWSHLMIESMKQAFTDVKACVTDPKFSDFNLDYYLSKDYGLSCANSIQDQAKLPVHKPAPSGGTVYLCTADEDGQMVSFIQSNYMGFGSGVVIPDTGISMHNRGHNFSFDPNHPNALMPRKRPYHTIIPGFIMSGIDPIGPFGVMGGFMQPQGHLQVLSNLIDFRMSPQEALNAPRWQWMKELEIVVEETLDQEVIKSLTSKGHQVSIAQENATFGRGQMIIKLKNGAYMGGTEMRCDGHIAIY